MLVEQLELWLDRRGTGESGNLNPCGSHLIPAKKPEEQHIASERAGVVPDQ